MQIDLQTFQDKYKEYLFQALDFFEKNQIPYSLAFGTMLGAAREKDIIKWDCDVDLWMADEDVKRFLKIANELSDVFYVKTFLNYEEIFGVTRIYIKTLKRKDGDLYNIKDAYIDIFHTFETETNQKTLFALGKKLEKYSLLYDLKYSKRQSKTLVKKIGRKFVCLFVKSNRFYVKKYLKLFQKKIMPGKKYLVSYRHSLLLSPLPLPKTYIKLQFGKRACFVFDNYKEILRIVYGSDYLTPIDYGFTKTTSFFVNN